MAKVRLDQLLVDQGYFPDTEAVLRAVIAHEVRIDDVYVTSAALKVRPDCDIFVKNARRFVSRGGHKLQGALDHFGQEVTGLRCIDVGSSTGGFTDCLLQAGGGKRCLRRRKLRAAGMESAPGRARCRVRAHQHPPCRSHRARSPV